MDIIEFLLEGEKNRNDFWEDSRFLVPKLGRGICPRKNLRLLEELGVAVKFRKNKKDHWKIGPNYVDSNPKVEVIDTVELIRPVIPKTEYLPAIDIKSHIKLPKPAPIFTGPPVKVSEDEGKKKKKWFWRSKDGR